LRALRSWSRAPTARRRRAASTKECVRVQTLPHRSRAEKAGLGIKKEHPILQVAVYDGVESVNKIIELP
jgi:hypothetical protein